MGLLGGIMLVQTMMAMSLAYPAMGALPLVELTLYATITTPILDGVLAPTSAPISPASSGSASSAVLVPNTFIAVVGTQLTTSLLTAGTPVLFWAVVQASDIANACQHIVTRGQLNINTTINDEQRGTATYMMLQVLSVGGGCLEVTGGANASMDSSPGSGLLVQVVSAIGNGRKALVLCPNNDAQEIGCAVYLIGSDIEALYIQFSRRQRNQLSSMKGAPSRSHTHRLDCPGGAEDGVIRGIVTGIFAAENCAGLGPRLAPFCIVGVMGVYAMMGAFDGCVSGTRNCFPGDAVVLTRGQHPKLMSELRLGDEVAVWRQTSAGHGGVMSTAYAEIYAFGHKDANATAVFLEIFVSPIGTDDDNGNENRNNLVLRISSMHFVATLLASSKSSSSAPSHESNMYRISSSSSKQLPTGTVVYKRAQDVNVGDVLWAIIQHDGRADDMGVVPCIVQDISIKRMQGLYNPFTMGGGTIIVDGVVASVHSRWFLDALFENLGITHLLPSIYQIVLSPVRLLYTMMGKDLYVSIYEWLDARIDISMFGINYGGTFIFSSVFAIVASTFLVLRHSK